MVGVWIPLSLLQPFTKDSLWWALAALVLFRFFDMVKPLGIKKLDRKKGAFYVMADDILGGIYAAIAMTLIKVGILLARTIRLYKRLGNGKDKIRTLDIRKG